MDTRRRATFFLLNKNDAITVLPHPSEPGATALLPPETAYNGDQRISLSVNSENQLQQQYAQRALQLVLSSPFGRILTVSNSGLSKSSSRLNSSSSTSTFKRPVSASPDFCEACAAEISFRLQRGKIMRGPQAGLFAASPYHIQQKFVSHCKDELKYRAENPLIHCEDCPHAFQETEAHLQMPPPPQLGFVVDETNISIHSGVYPYASNTQSRLRKPSLLPNKQSQTRQNSFASNEDAASNSGVSDRVRRMLKPPGVSAERSQIDADDHAALAAIVQKLTQQPSPRDTSKPKARKNQYHESRSAPVSIPDPTPIINIPGRKTAYSNESDGVHQNSHLSKSAPHYRKYLDEPKVDVNDVYDDESRRTSVSVISEEERKIEPPISRRGGLMPRPIENMPKVINTLNPPIEKSPRSHYKYRRSRQLSRKPSTLHPPSPSRLDQQKQVGNLLLSENVARESLKNSEDIDQKPPNSGEKEDSLQRSTWVESNGSPTSIDDAKDIIAQFKPALKQHAFVDFIKNYNSNDDKLVFINNVAFQPERSYLCSIFGDEFGETTQACDDREEVPGADDNSASKFLNIKTNPMVLGPRESTNVDRTSPKSAVISKPKSTAEVSPAIKNPSQNMPNAQQKKNTQNIKDPLLTIQSQSKPDDTNVSQKLGINANNSKASQSPKNVHEPMQPKKEIASSFKFQKGFIKYLQDSHNLKGSQSSLNSTQSGHNFSNKLSKSKKRNPACTQAHLARKNALQQLQERIESNIVDPIVFQRALLPPDDILMPQIGQRYADFGYYTRRRKRFLHSAAAEAAAAAAAATALALAEANRNSLAKKESLDGKKQAHSPYSQVLPRINDKWEANERALHRQQANQPSLTRNRMFLEHRRRAQEGRHIKALVPFNVHEFYEATTYTTKIAQRKRDEALITPIMESTNLNLPEEISYSPVPAGRIKASVSRRPEAAIFWHHKHSVTAMPDDPLQSKDLHNMLNTPRSKK